MTSVDRRRRVDVVHHQIEVAAIVQIHVRGAVRKTGLRQTPRFGHVREFEIAIVPKRVFDEWYLWHLLQQAQICVGDSVVQRSLHCFVADEADVVHVVRPAEDSVSDEQILFTIVVEVGEERRPAPVGSENTGQVTDLAEPALAAIELQCVARVLRLVARLQPQVVDVEALGVRRRLEDVLALGLHVERDDVGAPIVVEIGGIDAHRESAGVARRFRYRFSERPIAVVDVQVVVALKIVGNVDVRAPIVIEVARHDAQAIAVDPVVQAGRIGDIGKVAAVVPEQTIAGARARRAALRLRRHRPLSVGRVVQEIHVDVAVSVVVEEQRLRVVADVIQPVLFRAIGEGPVPVVDVEHVASVQPEVVRTRDVDVDFTVSVDVRHRNAGLPGIRIGDAGFAGYILEGVIPTIAIELIGAQVRGEIEIGQAVPIDVAHRDSAAVVVVEIVQDVEVGLLRQRVREGDPGRFRAE